MFRTVWILPALLLATAVGAEGVSDASLARSASLPFELERVIAGGSLLRVTRVQSGSAAARAGLRVGDVILRVDGKTYGQPASGRRALEHGTGGRKLELEIRRGAATRGIRFMVPAAPFEDIDGVVSHYESLTTEDGLKLRTITTRPKQANGRLPALYFVQWLSCDSIEYPLNPQDHGWQRMIQLLAARSGVVMMRTEKAGIGDSEGDCANLDYDTELEHHRLALRKLKSSPLVDPARVVIFGASMGGNMAALIAAETQPAGLVIWGTAIKSWFEHLVEFNRRHLELSGRAPEQISAIVGRQISFLEEFLIAARSPEKIAATDPALGAVWSEIRGTAGATLYGRPYRFHQQAQAKNWLGAVSRVDAPMLVLYGEYDWFEELDDHVLIARVAAKSRPGTARLVVVPGMDHHFSIYPSLEAAYRAEGGFVAPQRPVMEIVNWLQNVVGGGASRASSVAIAAPSSSATGTLRAPQPGTLSACGCPAAFRRPAPACVAGRRAA